MLWYPEISRTVWSFVIRMLRSHMINFGGFIELHYSLSTRVYFFYNVRILKKQVTNLDLFPHGPKNGISRIFSA